MPRKLKIAAVQMDATPAPVVGRLTRAAALIAEAAGAGAQLVVLPELFNTGYEYSDANYALPEPIDGPTATWMRTQAADYGIHLAGSFLLLDGDEVYNSALLIAPDGQTWRYDKNYPWAYERAYFREGRGITVADTNLGKLGLMICWDYAHRELWARYAGRVDAMVLASCPPAMHTSDVVFPDGLRLSTSELPIYKGDDEPFGSDLDAQAAWLRVPVVHTGGAGQFRSKVPLQALSLAIALRGRADFVERLMQMDDVYLEADYIPQTKIVDASGEVITRVTDEGDGYTLAEVELADEPPQPLQPQPKSAMTPLAYISSDWLPAMLMPWVYRRGLRRQFGPRMAPVDRSTKAWTGGLLAALGFGWLLGRLWKR